MPRWAATCVGGRRSTVLGAEEVDGGADLDVEVLQPARHPDRPRRVAEVAAQLAEHGREGEADERRAVLRVEPLDGLEDAEHADLDQVVERLAAVGEAAGAVAGDPAELLDEGVPQGGVAGPGELPEPLHLRFAIALPRAVRVGLRHSPHLAAPLDHAAGTIAHPDVVAVGRQLVLVAHGVEDLARDVEALPVEARVAASPSGRPSPRCGRGSRSAGRAASRRRLRAARRPPRRRRCAGPPTGRRRIRPSRPGRWRQAHEAEQPAVGRDGQLDGSVEGRIHVSGLAPGRSGRIGQAPAGDRSTPLPVRAIRQCSEGRPSDRRSPSVRSHGCRGGEHGHGTRAILAAFFANLGIAISKFIGFVITGSASMLAEAIHSVADTGNQALLLLGGRRARKEATPLHPVRLRARALLLVLRRRPRAVHPRVGVRHLRGRAQDPAPRAARVADRRLRHPRRGDPARGVLVPDRDRRVAGGQGPQQLAAVRPAGEDAGAAGRAARGPRRPASASSSPSPPSPSPRSPASRCGTASAPSRSACLLGIIAIFLADRDEGAAHRRGGRPGGAGPDPARRSSPTPTCGA